MAGAGGSHDPAPAPVDPSSNPSGTPGQGPAQGGQGEAIATSVWVRCFRRLGVNWTKELDFVVLPALLALGLFVLEILDLAGQTWLGPALSPPALLALSVVTIGWALWALHEQSGALGDRTTPNRKLGLHNAWRARTIAWDILVLGVASLGLVLVTWAGPTSVIPPRDLAVVEIAVLVVTVALLATFARYTAMAFSTDIESLVSRLDNIARDESEQRTRETERVTGAFEREVSKLIGHVERQVAATEEGLKAVATHLELISTSLAAQANLSKEIADAQRAAVAAQRKAAAEAANREETRRRAAEDAAAKRVDQIRPAFGMKLASSGTLFHKLTLYLQNEGGKAEGVRVEVAHNAGTYHAPPIPEILAGDTAPIGLGDVTGFYLATEFVVTVVARDVEGGRSVHEGSVNYTRTTGFWGQTKEIAIDPPGWIAMRQR